MNITDERMPDMKNELTIITRLRIALCIATLVLRALCRIWIKTGTLNVSKGDSIKVEYKIEF